MTLAAAAAAFVQECRAVVAAYSPSEDAAEGPPWRAGLASTWSASKSLAVLTQRYLSMEGVAAARDWYRDGFFLLLRDLWRPDHAGMHLRSARRSQALTALPGFLLLLLNTVPITPPIMRLLVEALGEKGEVWMRPSAFTDKRLGAARRWRTTARPL